MIVVPNCLIDVMAEPKDIFDAAPAKLEACLLAVSKSKLANDAPTCPIPSPNTENPLLSASISTCLSTPIIVWRILTASICNALNSSVPAFPANANSYIRSSSSPSLDESGAVSLYISSNFFFKSNLSVALLMSLICFSVSPSSLFSLSICFASVASSNSDFILDISEFKLLIPVKFGLISTFITLFAMVLFLTLFYYNMFQIPPFA